MRVIIYVEGSSDKNAMEALLKSLIAEKLQQGVRIEFFPIKGGNNDRDRRNTSGNFLEINRDRFKHCWQLQKL